MFLVHFFFVTLRLLTFRVVEKNKVVYRGKLVIIGLGGSIYNVGGQASTTVIYLSIYLILLFLRLRIGENLIFLVV